MERVELAHEYHKNGYNCCQSVLAAFSDITGLSEQASMDIGGGFGGGAGTGELCGALSGAIMTLGLMTPVDENDPVGSKKRTVALSREVQKRFSEKFGALRCQDLLAFSLPLYAEEGKTGLVIAVGCTGGHHRSVAVAHALAEFIRAQGYQVSESHRDMSRG